MKITILDKAKKKKFIAGLTNLGIKKIPQLLIRTGKERVRAYSGNLSKEEIMNLWHVLPFEGIGLYVGKDFISRSGVREVRLSIDGMHTWKDQLEGNIVVLTEKQEAVWFRGKNIELSAEQTNGMTGFVSVKSACTARCTPHAAGVTSSDFVGVGKIGNDGILYGFLPKERRRRN